MIIEYRSNNSGGIWWLEEKEWEALEKAGWKVKRKGAFVWTDNGDHAYDEEGYPIWDENKDEKFKVSDVPQYAFFKSDSVTTALKSWQEATGMDVTDEGCNCCGAPHSFSWEGGYGSGQGLEQYLFSADYSSMTRKELIERLEGSK